jgi:CubicO group peptidase (beta-lactamase class C family)
VTYLNDVVGQAASVESWRGKMAAQMHRNIKLVLVGLLAVTPAGVRHGWTTDPGERVSSDVEERIARIENGLLNPFAVKGQHAYNLVERMEHHNVPGVSIAFFEHGEITWARSYGYADVAQKTVVTPDTRFQAASISKPVTALAALHVVEEGKLALEEDVNATLKSWKVPENEYTREEKVTLRRLLTHTAGLTVHGFPGYASNENVPTIVQVLDGEKPANTAAVRVNTEPGKTSRYSGGGFTVIQLMLTDVIGKAFPELMSELVLRPAGNVHGLLEVEAESATSSRLVVSKRVSSGRRRTLTESWSREVGCVERLKLDCAQPPNCARSVRPKTNGQSADSPSTVRA